MGSKQNDLRIVIDKGLKIMYARLIEKSIRDNEDLVISDAAGNPIRVKATTLKHLVQ